MLDEVGVIHMNGRIYDSKLGRFLQADSLIQDPTNSQSLNRYSYVWSNPLNATDPSGYFVFALIAAVALAGADFVVAHLAVYALAGFADALLAGGSFKDALLAGISAGAFAGLAGVDFGGASFGLKETITRVAAFGTLGGVTSVLQGGKFGHGFRSAGLGVLTRSIATNISRTLDFGKIGKGIARTIAAGTTSKLTGGKFANGAASAALQTILTHAKHANKIPKSYSVEGQALSKEQKAIMKQLLSDTRTAVGIEGAEWLLDFDSVEIIVGADEFGPDGETGAAFRSEDGKTGRVTLYRDIFNDRHTAGDRLAIMGHEVRHLEPRNYEIYQDPRTRFRSQFKADQ